MSIGFWSRNSSKDERHDQRKLVCCTIHLKRESEHKIHEDREDTKSRNDRALSMPESGQWFPQPTVRRLMAQLRVCHLRFVVGRHFTPFNGGEPHGRGVSPLRIFLDIILVGGMIIRSPARALGSPGEKMSPSFRSSPDAAYLFKTRKTAWATRPSSGSTSRVVAEGRRDLREESLLLALLWWRPARTPALVIHATDQEWQLRARGPPPPLRGVGPGVHGGQPAMRGRPENGPREPRSSIKSHSQRSVV